VLKRVDANGGAPITLATIPDGRGGSWSPDGQTIVLAGRYTPIYRIPAAGGSPVEITKVDDRWSSHRWPEFLPDGRHFLFLASPNGNEDPGNTIVLGSIDGKLQQPLISNAGEPHYLNGCIVFVRDGIVIAQRFDERRLAITGDPAPLKEQQVQKAQILSRSIVTLSKRGTLVYQVGTGTATAQLTWCDRTGKNLGTIGEPSLCNAAVIAPDQKSIVAAYATRPQANLWMFDLVRGVKSRLTFNQFADSSPAWSPDGRKIVYTATAGSRFRLALRDLTTGGEQTLLEGSSGGTPYVTSWSADGERIMFTMPRPSTRGDIFWMSLAERKPNVYLGTQFIETSGRFSPDGKWVAYHANEGSGPDVYIAPFPPTGARWQVSSGGGISPKWRRDGKELFYILPSLNSTVMAVPVTLGTTPEIGQPAKLFDFRISQPGVSLYDVTADGRRFLLISRIGDEPPPAPLIVVQNFDRELRDALEHRD
jgi:Tol biopolymer transport system component